MNAAVKVRYLELSTFSITLPHGPLTLYVDRPLSPSVSPGVLTDSRSASLGTLPDEGHSKAVLHFARRLLHLALVGVGDPVGGADRLARDRAISGADAEPSLTPRTVLAIHVLAQI